MRYNNRPYTDQQILTTLVNVDGLAGGFIKDSQAGNLPATVTNDTASAGNLGEYLTQVLASGSAISLTNLAETTITSRSFTAGDWEIRGGVVFVAAAGTTVTRVRAGISVTSNTFLAAPDGGNVFLDAGFTTASTQALQTGVWRVSLAGPTTVFLLGYAAFGVSTLTAYGSMYGRRVR